MAHGLLPVSTVSLVLPVHNEADIIERVIAGIERSVSIDRIVEFVIIDDGSTDQSPAIIDRLALSLEHVVVIRHNRRRGYGCAVRAGIAASSGDVVVLMDADGQYDAGDIVPMIEALSDHSFVIGVRRHRADPGYRRLAARIGNWLARRLFLRAAVRDVNCGLKVFHGDELRSLELVSRGGFISTELLSKLGIEHRLFRQFEVRHYVRTTGTASGASPRVLWNIIREGTASLVEHRIRNTSRAEFRRRERR